MATLNQALLRPWLDSLDGIDWLNFQGQRLYALRHLREVAIRPVLLHAATRFWDSEVHVFRFGSQELCPTVEEFHAYLGSHDSAEPIIPMLRESMKNILKSKLGVSGNVAEFLTRGNAINIVQLYEMFSPPGDLTDFVYQGRRMTACCICLLAAFLLVPSVGQPSPLLVGVAAQIEARKDVAPLVLAETLMGLDAVRAGRTRVFGGSPLLLQVRTSLSSPFSISLIHFTSTLGLGFIWLLTCFLSSLNRCGFVIN
jgi:hypothetical protein